jgi:hypothetical protein
LTPAKRVCWQCVMSHDWTLRFLENRIADKRILRLIARWLKVGTITQAPVETPSISGETGGLRNRL